jgi:hypothetical protein
MQRRGVEGKVIPNVSPDLRGNVARALRLAERPRRGGAETPAYLRAFARDFEEFHERKAKRWPQPAAILRDEDGGAMQLPVLLKLDAPLINQLGESGIPLRTVDKDEAEAIMIDRIAEFLAVRSRHSGVAGRTTIVHSRREGDTVLVCKGYFLSTATAFGISTPARGEISPGRYTFGISRGGSRRFDGVIWTCPTIVNLDLP